MDPVKDLLCIKTLFSVKSGAEFATQRLFLDFEVVGVSSKCNFSNIKIIHIFLFFNNGSSRVDDLKIVHAR